MILRKITNPIVFQGNLNKEHYFEGWYYKQVSSTEKYVISFIPGISLFNNDYHSFIQYIYSGLDEKNNRVVKSGYFKFPLTAFEFKDNPFIVKTGENVFSETMINVKLVDDKINIQGTLRFDSITPIKKSILMPNIMGFFAYMPNMECYHGVISMNHSLSGVLKINNEEVDFSNGKGYIEKDWGTSFPKEYIWIQCNNFKNKVVSVTCSIANVPFVKGSFRGFICNVLIDGKEYRFATYNSSKLKVKNIDDGNIVIILENRKAVLKIEGVSKEPISVIAPKNGEMIKKINEEIAGEVKVKLYNKENKVVYKDIGTIAAMEVVGF